MNFHGIEEDPLPPKTVWAVRKAMGLSQEAFGEEVGVTRRTVISWEKDPPDNKYARACTGPARILIQNHAAKIKDIDPEMQSLLQEHGLLAA